MQPHNLIINGNMAIWQRGVSQTSTGYGCVDRFSNTVSGTVTFSQETTGLPSGFAYALKWTTGAGTSYGQVRQFIETENVKSLRSKTLTASAYVKVSSNYSGVISWEIGYSTGGDGSGASYTVLASTNATTASSSDASADYKRISCNVTIPADAVGLYIGIVPSVVQATGVSCSITGVQLEAGSTASPFAHENYGDTLQKCQRYYWTGSNINANAIAQANVSDALYTVRFPVVMRVAPTVTALSGGSTDAIIAISGTPSAGGATGLVHSTYPTHVFYTIQCSGGSSIARVSYNNGTSTASAEL
tara:strand:- start:45 stop:953 length:909 start_codon:yes stop_codon:yes gene_type:complete